MGKTDRQELENLIVTHSKKPDWNLARSVVRTLEPAFEAAEAGPGFDFDPGDEVVRVRIERALARLVGEELGVVIRKPQQVGLEPYRERCPESKALRSGLAVGDLRSRLAYHVGLFANPIREKVHRNLCRFLLDEYFESLRSRFVTYGPRIRTMNPIQFLVYAAIKGNAGNVEIMSEIFSSTVRNPIVGRMKNGPWVALCR